MINTQELRIGNLLYFVTTKNVCEITGICSDGFIESDSKYGTNGERLSEDFDPIPITEELLIKFGGVKNNFYENSYNINDFTYSLNDKKLFLYPESWDSCAFELHCEYVHHLQNLIFELTRKELILK